MVEECASEVVNVGTQTAHSELLQESSITQIHASREEMYRRIEAFCKHKRSQIDVNNVIEYTKPTARENTCARVDAVRVYTANSRRGLTMCTCLLAVRCTTYNVRSTHPIQLNRNLDPSNGQWCIKCAVVEFHCEDHALSSELCMR
jgi:hypothetical protein